MTTASQNDFLTLTGPGTPMGDLVRRYWIPALLSSEIPDPDCPPVRVKLLGERLIAFRDTAGRVGVMDEFCAHRGVSLWFGRNEEHGRAALITAGNTTPRANASRFLRSRSKAAFATRSSLPPTLAPNWATSSGSIWARLR